MHSAFFYDEGSEVREAALNPGPGRDERNVAHGARTFYALSASKETWGLLKLISVMRRKEHDRSSCCPV